MSLSTTRAEWPVNLGAYRRPLVGTPVSLFVASFLAWGGAWDPATVAAVIVTGAAELGVLLARDGDHGWRKHAKTVVSVGSTLLVAFFLALSAREGEGPTAGVGPLLLQLDPNDWLALGLLAVKSAAQALIPNADGKFDEDLLGDSAPDEHLVPALIPSTRGTGAVLGDERLETSSLPALTEEYLAELATAGRKARRLASPVPVRATVVSEAPALPSAADEAYLAELSDDDPTEPDPVSARLEALLAEPSPFPGTVPAPAPAPEAERPAAANPLSNLYGGGTYQ